MAELGSVHSVSWSPEYQELMTADSIADAGWGIRIRCHTTAYFVLSPAICRQQGEPKTPSGGSAGAELPVCNKANPKLKQNKCWITCYIYTKPKCVYYSCLDYSDPSIKPSYIDCACSLCRLRPAQWQGARWWPSWVDHYFVPEWWCSLKIKESSSKIMSLG